MVAGIKVISSVNSSVIVRKLPSTWVFHNAWKKGMSAWRQMIDNATDEAGSQSIKGRFLDFKIFADAKHHNQGVSANLLPQTFDDSLGTVPAAVGQWQMSDITIPTQGTGAAVDFELIGVGPNLPGS